MRAAYAEADERVQELEATVQAKCAEATAEATAACGGAATAACGGDAAARRGRASELLQHALGRALGREPLPQHVLDHFYDLRQLLVEGHLEDDVVAHGPPIPKMVLVPTSYDEVDLHWW